MTHDAHRFDARRLSALALVCAALHVSLGGCGDGISESVATYEEEVPAGDPDRQFVIRVSVFEFGSAVVVEQLHQLGGGTRQRGAAKRGLLQ